jgi:hypothetical protein
MIAMTPQHIAARIRRLLRATDTSFSRYWLLF